MKGILKSVGVVMILTLLSRFFALASNQIYLMKLSIDSYMDAFTYAVGLPNIIFAGLGTALTTVVVPIYAEFMEKGDKRRAFKFISNITGISILVTLLLALAGIILTPLIIQLGGFAGNGDYGFAVFAVRCMLPVMVIYAVTYIFQGVLQSSGRFVAPSIVSLPGSILVIAYSLFFAQEYGIKGLLFATIAGLSFQVFIMVPSIYKTGFRFKVLLKLKDKDLISAIRLIPPVFVGAAAWQVNMFYNSTLALNFKDGATLMGLVQNLITSGVLTLVYSVTAVVFPKLSVLFAKNKTNEFKQVFRDSIGSTLFLVIPIAFGFIVLGHEILNLIYGWGRVTEANINMAAMIMAFYAFGIIGHSIKEIGDRAFYSMKNTGWPALNGLIIMAINVLTSLVFVNIMGVYGIPLAYSISLTLGALFILIMLKRHIGSFGAKEMFVRIGKILFAAVVMSLSILIIKKISYNISVGIEFLDRTLVLFIPVFSGMIIYFMMGLILKLNEAGNIYNRIRKITGKNQI